jgi:hypothetical protein
MSLCAEVLFVRDPQDHHRYHPRITVQYTHSYRYLDTHVKEAFNRLYDEFYYHRHNYFWREEAMKKLPVLISSTRMMACGEDLGMVPDCVPSVMHELQMLSLEIERCQKTHSPLSPIYSGCLICRYVLLPRMTCRPFVCGGLKTGNLHSAITTKYCITKELLRLSAILLSAADH